MTRQDVEKNQKIAKQSLNQQLHGRGNAFSRYREKVLGKEQGFLRLLQFELSQLLFANLAGGFGYLLRRFSLASLFKHCGKGLILGRGITLRTPGNISLGENSAIDDNCLLDGGTGKDCRVFIGDRVIISRGCVIQAKTGPLEIADRCDIGAHCLLTSAGGISLAPSVLIAGNCYIGGARYNLHSTSVPILEQGTYSRGPISIGEGTWIGAGATILDGVTIGRGAVIGAGSLVTRDIADFSIAIGRPARVIRQRTDSSTTLSGQESQPEIATSTTTHQQEDTKR
jgi:acetyltransferase-like isoleucine patch superfamily enzyme